MWYKVHVRVGIWPFEATFFAHAYKKGAVIGIFQIVSQGACTTSYSKNTYFNACFYLQLNTGTNEGSPPSHGIGFV